MASTGLEPIPDRLVVLTFDDGCRSCISYVAPLLKDHGFGATFYICERFMTDTQRYLTWDEVRQLHDDGFEIGNHTRDHKKVNKQPRDQVLADVSFIDRRCQAHGIPVPETFCYPGYQHSPEAAGLLVQHGFRFARRGVWPEFPYHEEGGRGPAYDPAQHHPLLIPTTGAAGPNWGFEDLAWAVAQAKNGKIAVLTFHGVPDLEHPWVHTEPDAFESYMRYLRDNDCTVIAMRDLGRFVDPESVLRKRPGA